MPLQKQLVPINFTGGLDGKADPKLVVPGKLTILENGQFQSSNTISKRPGRTAITSTRDDGASLGNGSMLGVFGNELVHVDTTGQVCALADVGNVWVRKGFVPLNTITATPVVRNTSEQYDTDCALGGGWAVYVWSDPANTSIRCSIFDDAGTAGVSYSVDSLVEATGYLPRLIYANGLFCLIYVSGTNLKLRTMSPALPVTWSAATTLKTDVDVAAYATTLFDATATAATLFVAYRRSSDSTINLFSCSTAGSVATTVNKADTPLGAIHVQAFNSNTCIALLYGRSAIIAAPRCRIYDLALSNLASADVVDASAPAVQPSHITSKVGATGELIFAYDSNNTYTGTGSTDQAATIILVGAVSFGLTIASNIFTLNGESHIALTNWSNTQSTTLVMALSGSLAGRIVAKALAWRAWPLTGHRVPSTHLRSTTAIIPARERGRLSFSNGLDTTPKGITALALAPMTATERVAVEIGDNLFFASACPSIYDGVGIVEQGFHFYPDTVTVAQAGAGALADGAYQVAVCYEWVDAKGRLHRSAPSVAGSCTVTGGSGVASLNVTVPYLTVTAKTTPRAQVNVAFFRTVADGSIFYRATSFSSPTPNVPTVTSFTKNLSAADSTIQSNEVIYTTGDILENEPCPPCRIATVHQRRLVVSGTDRPNEVVYSKELVDGEAVGFNEILTHTLPADGASISALASMDDKLLISKEDSWYAVAGEGPNAAGQQNGYTVPQLVVGETGCKLSCSRSVQVSDAGIWFQSSKGIRLLGRNLSIASGQDGRFIGSDVDSLLTTNVVATVIDRSTDQIRFYPQTNALVYDEHWRQWSRFSPVGAVDAVRWGSTLVHVLANGVAYQGAATYLDAGSPITLRVETGWLAMAGVQGFQRVYELMLLGTFYDTASLSLEVGYDYADAYQTAVTLTTGTNYVTGTPLQLRYSLPIQKCEALRFRIAETNGSANFALSSFALLMGGKGGAFKLPATKSTG